MTRKGLGKGLDSLIPNIYDENFNSNDTQSLEDMLKSDEGHVDEVVEDIESGDEEIKVEDEKVSDDESEKIDETADVQEDGENQKSEEPSQEISGDEDNQQDAQTSQEIKLQEKHIEEVKKIVDKNPRITLWSSRSSAVFRYLRKTEPEFSISKEASRLIEEAVSKKYPEIWALFEDY